MIIIVFNLILFYLVLEDHVALLQDNVDLMYVCQ